MLVGPLGECPACPCVKTALGCVAVRVLVSDGRVCEIAGLNTGLGSLKYKFHL